MKLASLQSQAEYDRLEGLLRAKSKWVYAVIAGYRSEVDDKEWMDASDKIKFQIRWASGEPNNYDGNENCLSWFLMRVCFKLISFIGFKISSIYDIVEQQTLYE